MNRPAPRSFPPRSMRFTVVAALAASLTACSSSRSSGRTGAPLGEPIDESACVFPLVTLRTGPASDCSGQNAHRWPVGMAATDCHGWKAIDTSGKEHNNSANQIACNADGSFSFVQYAGVLDCSGTGTLKTYVLNVCAQDTPPSLYTVAEDLTCCVDPNSAACSKGVPTVDVPGASIYLNNQHCGL
jgi:hypothetical protein